MKRQKTFDDAEPVLESENFPPQPNTRKSKKLRIREALAVYDEIEAKKEEYHDPLF